VLVVIYEDRPQVLVGVQLAILSLAQHSKDLPVLAIVPGVGDEFLRWSERFPNLTVRADREGVIGQGWNVKPSVLKNLLEEGKDQVLWFDSDLVVTGDLGAHLARFDDATVVGAEEYAWGHHQGSDARTVGLGLSVARTFPATINTCLLRVSQQHRALVDDWHDILASEAYLAAQRLPARDRPFHLWSDLQVFTGLMGSTKYGDVPVELLARGSEIAQCYGPSGYTVLERLRAGRELPLLVHAMGAKPWAPPSAPIGARRGVRLLKGVEAVHQDLTPYVEVARAYRGQFDGDDSWLEPRTRAGRLLTRMFPRRPAARELPLAMLDTTARQLRAWMRIGRIAAAASD